MWTIVNNSPTYWTLIPLCCGHENEFIVPTCRFKQPFLVRCLLLISKGNTEALCVTSGNRSRGAGGWQCWLAEPESDGPREEEVTHAHTRVVDPSRLSVSSVPPRTDSIIFYCIFFIYFLKSPRICPVSQWGGVRPGKPTVTTIVVVVVVVVVVFGLVWRGFSFSGSRCPQGTEPLPVRVSCRFRLRVTTKDPEGRVTFPV